jgi:hypothetical protein
LASALHTLALTHLFQRLPGQSDGSVAAAFAVRTSVGVGKHG